MKEDEEIERLAISLRNSGLAASLSDATEKARSILGFSNKGTKIRVSSPSTEPKPKIDNIIEEFDKELKEIKAKKNVIIEEGSLKSDKPHKKELKIRIEKEEIEEPIQPAVIHEKLESEEPLITIENKLPLSPVKDEETQLEQEVKAEEPKSASLEKEPVVEAEEKQAEPISYEDVIPENEKQAHISDYSINQEASTESKKEVLSKFADPSFNITESGMTVREITDHAESVSEVVFTNDPEILEKEKQAKKIEQSTEDYYDDFEEDSDYADEEGTVMTNEEIEEKESKQKTEEPKENKEENPKEHEEKKHSLDQQEQPLEEKPRPQLTEKEKEMSDITKFFNFKNR